LREVTSWQERPPQRDIPTSQPLSNTTHPIVVEPKKKKEKKKVFVFSTQPNDRKRLKGERAEEVC